MATSLNQSGNQYQTEHVHHMHQHVATTSENLVKIGFAVSEISMRQSIIKKEEERKYRKESNSGIK